MTRYLRTAAATVTVAGILAIPPAFAAVIAVGPGAFGPGSTLTTFTGLAAGTEVNGLVVNGITFQYSLGNDHVITNGGPGTTNNVEEPNVVSIGDNTGVLTMLLPGLVDTFGYGYAVLAITPVASATTIALFNGATLVGSLSFDALPDPTFSGGFAGIHSTLAFDRVEVTFESSLAPAFALDNIRTASNGALPEPGTLALLGLALAGLATARKRKQ